MRADAMSTVVTLLLQAMTLLLQAATLAVAVWATWTARRSLKVAVSPQIECFLRPQQASPLVDFVIQNTGAGNAYNVGWKIEADEHDFKSHVGDIGPPLEKAVPFSVVEAGGVRTTSFGVLPHLMNAAGADGVPMKPFVVTITFEWTFPWTNRRRRAETKQEIDVRQFEELIWNQTDLQKAVKALEALESNIREVVERTRSRHE